MEIHFGPKIRLAERIRQLRRPQRVIAPPTTLGDFIRSPLICLSAPHITQVPAVEVYGKGKTKRLIRVEDMKRLFNEGRLAFAHNESKDYLVMEEAFDEHTKEIYTYESLVAVRKMDSACSISEHPSLPFERALFLRVEGQILAGSKPANLRHLAYMLKEVSEIGCDYITATAVLLHNLNKQDAERILTGRQKKSGNLLTAANQVQNAVERFREINGIPYLPPAKKVEHHIQNYLDAMIKIAKGDGRALLLLLVHKLSSIKMQTDDARDITGRAVREIIAPLAERLGLIPLAIKIRNESFRLYEPEKYKEMEAEILAGLSLSRTEAEELLNQVSAKLSEELEDNKSLIRTRVKTPWGAYAKTQYKGEEYPEIYLMNDLLAGMVITKRALKLEEAIDHITRALGDEFCGLNSTGGQVETKYYTVGDRKVQVHHVGVSLKNGNSIEFQFMDESAYQTIERGYLAHWAYKLEMLTGQKFDRELLEICAQRMNGDIIHDAKMIYQTLLAWVYVFANEEKFIRVIRLEAGAIPANAAAFLLHDDLSYYNGSRIGKIWEDTKKLRTAGEIKLLQDGDYLSLKPLKKPLRRK